MNSANELSSSANPARLVNAARGGDRESLQQLLALYVNYLKLLATSQLDNKLRARCSPSDLVQETLMEACRDFPMFRGSSEREFVVWLRKILVNNMGRLVEQHVLTQKRDVRREVSLNNMRRSLEKSTMRLEAVLADHGESPSSNLQRRERAVILADHLAKLAPDHRQVVVLRNLESLPFNQVAIEMNRSTGAVRMLWLRAIEQLRRSLSAEGLV